MTEHNDQYEAIKLDLIDTPDVLNGRFEVSQERVELMARNIQSSGLLHPITLRVNGGRYTLVAGNHRLLAYRQLGYETIPAKITQYTDTQAALAQLSENAIRAQITPVEEAKQLNDLVENDPNGVDGISMKIGRPVNWILDRLEIMSWPDSLIECVHSKLISLAAARILAKITPESLLLSYVNDAAENGINAKTASLWLQHSRSQSTPNFEASEISRNPHNPEYETSTRVNCFVCKNQIELERTHSVRVCHGCLDEIEQAARRIESPPMERPSS